MKTLDLQSKAEFIRMNRDIKKILFFNQMAGPLFRELAEDLAKSFPDVSILRTGHADTLAIGSETNKLVVVAGAPYKRFNTVSRITSWLQYTASAFFAMLNSGKGTVIFIVSNPPFLGPAAWLVNKLKGTPYIVLVYDLHPDTMVAFKVLKERSFITKVWRKINKRVWEGAVAVYTLGPVMAEKLTQQFNAGSTALGYVGVVPPWADTDRIKPMIKAVNPSAKELDQQDKITVLYSGNMGISHDIESILQAAYLLRDHSDISFLMIGEGAKWQYALDFQNQYQLANLQVLPLQPEDKLQYTMPLADIALVTLDTGAEGLMIPSKMFYYLAAGAALVGICSGRNDVAEIVNQAQCGVLVKASEPEKLALAIKELAYDTFRLRNFKVKAREAAVSSYSRKICTQRISKDIKKIFKNQIIS